MNFTSLSLKQFYFPSKNCSTIPFADRNTDHEDILKPLHLITKSEYRKLRQSLNFQKSPKFAKRNVRAVSGHVRLLIEKLLHSVIFSSHFNYFRIL